MFQVWCDPRAITIRKNDTSMVLTREELGQVLTTDYSTLKFASAFVKRDSDPAVLRKTTATSVPTDIRNALQNAWNMIDTDDFHDTDGLWRVVVEHLPFPPKK